MGIAPTIGGRGGQIDPLGVAIGVKFEPYPPYCANTQAAPTTQTVFGIGVYGLAGSLVTGIKLRNAVAAAGTLPTTARFGIADNTGKILAVSANLTALASWPAGVCSFPFSAPLALPYDGFYYLCYVVNGTWSVTQPTPLEIAVSGAAFAADGTFPVLNFQWAAQTDLPAVGASLTLSTQSSRNYYLALY